MSSFLKPSEFFWNNIANLSCIKSCTLAKQINKRKVQQSTHLNKSIVVTILYFFTQSSGTIVCSFLKPLDFLWRSDESVLY